MKNWLSRIGAAAWTVFFAAVLAASAHAAFDDVHVEDENAIEARERMQEEFAESQKRADREGKTSPDTVLKVVERSGFGAGAESVELDVSEAHASPNRLASAGGRQTAAREEASSFPAPRHYVTMLLAVIAVFVIGKSIPLKGSREAAE